MQHGNDNVQGVQQASQHRGEDLPALWNSGPAKKKARGGIGKWLLIVFAIGVVAAVLPKKDKVAASRAEPKAAAV